MTEPFPLAGYRQPMAQVAESVFETMFSVPVKEAAQPGEPVEGSFTAAVYYSGTWQGALVLECARAQAMDWAARYLSLVSEAALDDARDCLGELTNVIAGNLKPLLPPGVSLSFPSVVEGSDYTLRLCGGNLSETLFFQDGGRPFRITLVEVIAPNTSDGAGAGLRSDR